MLRLLNAVSNRATVSRDESIIWAMSYCANNFSIRVHSLPPMPFRPFSPSAHQIDSALQRGVCPQIPLRLLS